VVHWTAAGARGKTPRRGLHVAALLAAAAPAGCSRRELKERGDEVQGERVKKTLIRF